MRKYDCLIIGHNDMNFPDYVQMLKSMGTDHANYRDLNLNFIEYQGKPFRALDILTHFYFQDKNGINRPFHNFDLLWMTITYLGTYLSRRGYTFDYVNLFQLEKDRLKEKLEKQDFLTVVITTSIYNFDQPILEVISFIKRYNDTAKIIVGGPYISKRYEWMEPAELKSLFKYIGADFYVCNREGEQALMNILKALKSQRDFDNITNIAYKKGKDYVITPATVEINPLEDNMIDYSLFPGEDLGEFVNLRISKGCPYTCSFCGFPLRARKYKYLSVDHIEKELDAIRDISTVKSIFFIDDTLNVPKKRFKDMLRMMIRKKYDFKWHCFFRCDQWDEETIELMKESRCEGVFLGLESANDTLLKNMNKNVGKEVYRKTIPLFKKAGMIVFISTFVGFPGETAETFQETMDFLEETQPDFYRPQLWYCEPLTPIWQQREKYGLKGYHFGWSHDTMDARTACDLLEKAFLSLDTPIWVPDPGFNFVSLYYLRQRGMSIEQVKAFLRCFNAVVREKLLYPNKEEVSPHLLENLRISCQFDQPVYPDMGLIEVGDPHASISESQVLTEAQRYQLLVEWNDTRVDYPRDKCNHQLFEDHAGRTPEAAALVYADQRLTYRKVNHLANRLARHLQTLGVGPDVMVGICLNRSLELVIALLGVLKAGGAYVPLDSTYPKERLATMLEDADMLQVLLTKENLLDRLPAHKAKVVCLDNDWEVIARESTQAPNSPVTVHNLVYVIFTSGSTGRPKGAGVYHSGWTNLMNWFTNEFNITPLDKVLVISSFSFDITQRSLAMPLIVGGELHLLASNYYDPQLIIQTIFNEKITLLNCSPSTFYPLIEDTAEHTDTFWKLSSLRCLFLGGEAISASRLHHWAKSNACTTEIANVYGAAECTDVSSFYRLRDFKRYIKSSVPAGKPIFNSQVYILDKNLNLVPMGEPGEICIAGDGVGKGYINDEALTAVKYVSNPFSSEPGSRLYKTGDLGRFLPDGNIEFIGRVDHQVKVRGLRVDLGDIETVLRQHPAVKEAVVVDKEFSTGDQRLVAYWVPGLQNEPPTQGRVEIDSLRIFLKEKIPPYMVPNVFVMLEKLPLSPNGKLDRDALPEPEASRSGMKEIELPRTPIEKEIVTIFAEILKLEQLGINDNFFESGGHSLMVTQVISRVNEIFQVQLSQVDLLVDPTVAGMAKRIETVRSKEKVVV